MNTKKKIKLLDFKLTKNLGASLFGEYKSKFTGVGMDFVKHKEYIPGDPIKNIDWKTAGKSDKLYSKVFEDERDLKVLFMIDMGDSMTFSTGEKTKIDVLEELFYPIALSASLGGDSIGAFLYSGNNNIFFDYKKGFSNVFSVIEKLNNKLNFSSKSTGNETKNALELIYKRNIKNNLIFILTDDTNVIDEKNLKLLSITNEIIYINVFDYFENNLTNGKIGISLKDNNNFLNIDLDNIEKIEEFREIRKEKINGLDNYLKRNKISYKIFDTKTDIFKELYLFFSKDRTKIL